MIIRALTEQFERRALIGGWGDVDPAYLDGRIPPPSEADGGISYAGPVVNDRTAMRLTAVYACVSLIAEVIAGLPVGTFTKVGGVPRPVEPELPFIVDPHHEMDQVDWVTRTLVSALLRGNTYGYVDQLGPGGTPLSVLPLDPRSVAVRRARDTGRINYRVAGERETFLAWPLGPIWHWRGLTLPGDIKGCSPIEYARQSIGLNLATEEFGARFFSDGANPSVVLHTDEKITDENLARSIVARFRRGIGSGRRRKVALLTHGTKAERLTIPPNDAQFLETRDFGVNEISRLYRVPPHMIAAVNRTTSWGSGIEQLSIGFVTYTLGPWIRRSEQALTRLVRVGAPERYVRFNVAGLLRGDFKARTEGYARGRQWGWLNVDDIRALEELPPLPAGQGAVYLQPSNMVAAGGADLGEASPRELAEMLQKIYLAVGKVITADEAREIVNRAGAGLDPGFPDDDAPRPAPGVLPAPSTNGRRNGDVRGQLLAHMDEIRTRKLAHAHHRN